MTESKEWYSIGEILEKYWGDISFHKRAEAKLDESLKSAHNYYQKLAAIRQYYLDVQDKIIEQHHKEPRRFYYAYPMDWTKMFTPIEEAAWCTIRCKGHIVLYPQYPALQYSLDFANPGLKIAVELDGKMHDQDKDRVRDFNLKHDGWTIYRIPGREMLSEYKDFSDLDYSMDEDEKDEHIKNWMLKTGDGVLQAIKQRYFLDPPDYEDDEDDDWDNRLENRRHQNYLTLCDQTLELHKS